MFTVSNALLTSNHTTIVLLMLCSAMLVECLVLNPCCVVWYALCYIMEESPSVFFAITDRRDIGQYEVHMLMPLLGLRTGIILANVMYILATVSVLCVF